MLSRFIYIILLLLAIAVVAMGIGLYFANQNASPVTPPVFSPPPSPSPTQKVDKPAYQESDVIAFARQLPEVQALYTEADNTKDYKFPLVKDFNWTSEYKGNSRWLVTLTYAEWDFNAGSYVAKARYWFFDETKPTLIPAN